MFRTRDLPLDRRIFNQLSRWRCLSCHMDFFSVSHVTWMSFAFPSYIEHSFHIQRILKVRWCCPLLCLKKRHTHMNILILLLGFGDKFTWSPKANSCFTEGRCERTWYGGTNESKCSKIRKRKLVEIILLNVMLELILTTDVVSLLGYQMLSFTTVWNRQIWVYVKPPSSQRSIKFFSQPLFWFQFL